jgi:hypothetical protein
MSTPHRKSTLACGGVILGRGGACDRVHGYLNGRLPVIGERTNKTISCIQLGSEVQSYVCQGGLHLAVQTDSAQSRCIYSYNCLMYHGQAAGKGWPITDVTVHRYKATAAEAWRVRMELQGASICMIGGPRGMYIDPCAAYICV